MTRAAVFGTGSWGTAFAKVLADAGTDVVLWARRPELAAVVQETRENPDYLPGVRLPDRVAATGDAREALAGAEAVVLALPSQSLRENLAVWAPHVPAGAPLVSLMKGVEAGTTKRMSEVIAEVTGAGPERIGVVSGPNLAKEIARREPAASVVACADDDVAHELRRVLDEAARGDAGGVLLVAAQGHGLGAPLRRRRRSRPAGAARRAAPPWAGSPPAAACPRAGWAWRSPPSP